MKRTDKHVKKTAKPAQPAFKTPAQELLEFEAKVLATKYGPVIWMALTMEESDNDPRLLSEWVAMVLTPFPAILRRSFPNTLVDKDSAAPLADRLLHAAMREVGSKVDELWPEYVGLLNRSPDELKAYRERYNQNRLPPDTIVRPRELRQEPGRPRNQKQAARDAKIVYLYDVQKYGSFGKIARKLKIYDKHGAPSGAKAYSAYRRYKVETETKSLPNSDTET